MKNRYLENLRKIEFVITSACTGSCKHCSQGEHAASTEKMDPVIAANVVKRVASLYDVQTVMAFGGEPLLHPDAVYAVIAAAKEAGVCRRQLITNGFFSKDTEKIRAVAGALALAGVNDLLLSVDAFHQETIPLEEVKRFAELALSFGIPLRLQPAWLVSESHDNPYNRKTREILDSFGALAPVGEGNVIFPEGNARLYLAEYFKDGMPQNPYIENSRDVRTLSVSSNGDVLDGNVYKRDILDILESYAP